VFVVGSCDLSLLLVTVVVATYVAIVVVVYVVYVVVGTCDFVHV